MIDRLSDCAAMRELLLEAEPAELRGTGVSPVARHIRDCSACAAAAQRVLDAQTELAMALTTLTASSAAVGRPARVSVLPLRRTAASRRTWKLTSAFAAAAALALIVMQSRNDAVLEPLPGPLSFVADAPVVNATGTAAVAVMKTSNPNITIVWYLERER